MRNFILAGLLAAGSVFSTPVITVIPTLGPDYLTSSNFDLWATNVVQGMINSTTPGSGVQTYVPLANGASLTGGEFIATPFESWQGVAPGPYSGELGTALYFSVMIVEPDLQLSFKMSDLAAQEIYLGQTQSPYPAGTFTAFSTYLVGLKQGNAGYVDSGTGDPALQALYYVGLGFVQPLDPSGTGTDQDKINFTIAQIQALQDRTTQVCYTLGEASGCGYVNVEAPAGIPEPGTMALLGAGLAGLAFLRRRSA